MAAGSFHGAPYGWGAYLCDMSPAIALVLALVQGSQATVVGTVRDAESGEPIAGAVVELSDLGRGAATDSLGGYAFAGVPPGPQHLRVALLGYEGRTLHLLVPRTGRLAVDVALRGRPIELRSLVVAPPRPVRGLDPGDSTAFPDRGVSASALAHHPLFAQPDAFRALAGGEVVVDPEAASGLHIRGGAADQTAFLLDGIPILNPYHANGLFSAWNPDALDRLSLLSAAPPPGLPPALSGVVSALTREPGARFGAQGAVSTAEARVTVDGPAGLGDAGYLLSWRSGFAGSPAPSSEASYVGGEATDVLGGLRAPLLGGRLQLLFYEADSEVDAAATPPPDGSAATGPRNTFEWSSRSLGATWLRSGARGSIQLRVWRAAADAGTSWWRATDADQLRTRRRDLGANGSVTLRDARGATELGARLGRLATVYDRRAPAGDGQRLESDLDLIGVYAERSQAIASRLTGSLGASATHARGVVHTAPRAQLRWQANAASSLTLSYSRSHQFSQSLRNPESVTGHVFPVDLSLAAGAHGVPVPRGDQVVLAGELRPAPSLRVGAQLFARSMADVLVVAASETEPFATGNPAVGSASARGVSLDLAASGARYVLLAGWVWQRVTQRAERLEFEPRHGTAHLLDAGLIVYPVPTASLRLGASWGSGRNATAVAGPFEWEACNLLDQGCEFAGTPRLTGDPGGESLPRYLRVDLGARKHWHVRAGGRDAVLGVFATISNVFGNGNVLTYVVDPDTGEREAVDMLPRSPLVLGLDWRF